MPENLQFKELNEENRRFFNDYFWMVNNAMNDVKAKQNREQSPVSVRPFLSKSKELYWEKAYLEFLNHQGRTDTAAIAADTMMTAVYTTCNAFNSFSPAIKQLAHVIPIVGIAWNMIDASGAFVLAARDATKKDNWVAGTNIASGVQLLVGTAFFTLYEYNKQLHMIALAHALAGQFGTAGASALAAGASGFTFAAAMAFSCALEHREVKLHQARIEYLNNRIQILQTSLKEDESNQCPWLLDDAKCTDDKKISDIDRRMRELSLENSVTNCDEQNKYNKYKDLKKLIQFRQHQRTQLETHQRARTSWGLCTVFMLAVAVTSVVVIALGMSVLTWGIAAPAVAAGCAFLFSALYRQKPDVEKAVKAIAQGVGLYKNTDKRDNGAALSGVAVPHTLT